MKWMLSCRQAAESVSRSLDGTLPAGEKWALRIHLLMCPDCLRFARQMRKLQHCLQILQTAERFVHLPDAVRDRIKRQLHQLATQGETP